VIKGFSLDNNIREHEIVLNTVDEYGFNLRFKENEKNFFKESVRHRNMRNSIKIKEKK